MGRLGSAALALVIVAAAGVAMAQSDGDPPQGANCAGDGAATYVVTGTFDASREGSYVFVPFDVPEGTTRVRVKLSHDGLAFPNPVTKHTLDLGLYGAGPGDDGLWGRDEFRGWGGSSRLDACVSPDEATLGFLPGAIDPGRWAAEIGVAAIAGPDEGDPDATVAWRLEVFLSDDPAHADDPWAPTPYDSTPADEAPGWYAGDFHVHAEHSNPADAPMREVFDHAFTPIAGGGAGLDFITLSDYVTTRHWDEIGHFQADHPGKLVIRSAEVITYRGHVNNHATVEWVDYRAGDVFERHTDGSLTLLRPAAEHTARDIFEEIHAAGGGWSQVNHPTTFPSTVPAFANLCRGCSWEYSDTETDWTKVDAFEIHTGPAGTGENVQGQRVGLDGTLGPNPFTPLAVEWWDRLHREGHDITGVGVSDSHKAARQDVTISPVGEATTVVYARELSEAGIRDAVLAGHAYVKLFGNHGPDLRFEARRTPGSTAPDAIMGDEVVGDRLTMSARVLGRGSGPGPLTLHVLRDGVPVHAVPVDGTDFRFDFEALVPGDYRLQVQRGPAIEAISNPITLVVPGHPLSHSHDRSPGKADPRGHAGRPSSPGPPARG